MKTSKSKELAHLASQFLHTTSSDAEHTSQALRKILSKDQASEGG